MEIKASPQPLSKGEGTGGQTRRLCFINSFILYMEIVQKYFSEFTDKQLTQLDALKELYQEWSTWCS